MDMAKIRNSVVEQLTVSVATIHKQIDSAQEKLASMIEKRDRKLAELNVEIENQQMKIQQLQDELGETDQALTILIEGLPEMVEPEIVPPVPADPNGQPEEETQTDPAPQVEPETNV
jgi:predicted  nucleic acid-binding Zn-ribbon protein